jgi:transposase
MQPYSMDLRVRVLADLDAGLPVKDVAAKFSVSPAWVRRLRQRRRESGETAPRTPRRTRPCLAQTHGAQLRAAVAVQADATLAELRQQLGLTVALSTLWLALDALGLRLKKKSPAPPNRTDPTCRTSGPVGRRRSRG